MKSGRTMAANRFKFQSFTQRIASIKIDVVHRIGEAREVPDEEQDTFFRECLAKWSELNCTQDFVNFHKDVNRLVQDLKQLLFYKDEVFEILCRHMNRSNSTCLDALLDLMAQLTRDLQYEIYPYFQRILDTLTNLLNSHDADIIENTFVCLAFIFKYLWRYMIHDSREIYGYYKRLLMNSQKSHIRQFAAESIAFLVRKIRDKKIILDVLLSSAEDDPNLIEGVGTLLFETIKGTNQMFHSCAHEIISLTLKELARQHLNDDDDDEVFKCLEVTFKAACKHTSKKASSVLWDCLFLDIGSILSPTGSNFAQSSRSNQEDFLSSKIISLVKLFLIMVEWKDGLLVGDYAGKIKKMLNELIASKYGIKCGNIVLDFFAQLIQSNTINSPLGELQHSIDLIFKAGFEESHITNFLKKCKASPIYYQILLPHFLKYVESSLFNEMDYQSEKSVLLIKCLCEQVSSSKDYFIGVFQSKYDELLLMHFSKIVENDRKDGCTSVADMILKHLTDFSNHAIVPDRSFLSVLDTVWCCVLLLPYLRPLNSGKALNSLLQLVQSCISVCLKVEKDVTGILLFLISQAIRSFYLIKSSSTENTVTEFAIESLLPLLQHHLSNEHILQGLEYYFKLWNQNDVSSAVTLFQRLFDIVKYNLSSHKPIVRYLTLLILQHLSAPIEVPKSENFKLMTIQKCLNTEKVVASFETYMERLLHLRKLVYCSHDDQEDQNFYNEVVIRLLVGNLRVNLRPMWSPIMDVIKTHEQNGKQFWPVFREILLSSFSNNDSNSNLDVDYGCCTFSQYISIASELNVLNRPDDNNFRLLMCQTMVKFPRLVESKSRDVLPLFFTFLRKEYGRFDECIVATQDLTTYDHQTIDQSDGMLENDAVDDCETKRRSMKKQRPANKVKIMRSFLALFGQFKNPKALYQESKLYDVYLELMMHRDNEIQQLVWNCLKTYKFDYLKPYEEHIDKLFQDNTFRDALTLFSASDDDQVVKLEHRSGVINILIRLLYGKLQRRSGLGVGGKTNQSVRRNIIINFISCCSNEEVSVLINLITDPFKYLSHGCHPRNDIDLRHVIPLRKQIGFLNMLHTVLKKLSNLIGQHIDHLMTTLLDILTLCQACLAKRDQIANSYVGKLRSIRQLCISRITDFFQFFHDFNFEPYIEKIFSSAIIHQVSRLSSESQQHPSPLLKLLHHWSSSKRYFYLLDKNLLEIDKVGMQSTVVEVESGSTSPGGRKPFPPRFDRKTEDNARETPLQCIFSILAAKDKSDVVVKMVMSIAENVLQMQERREDPVNSDGDLLTPCAREMVAPYVTILLDHFCNAIRHRKSLKKNQQKVGVFQEELGVLALISNFAKEPEQCQTIVSLLFPTLKLVTNEKEQCNTLITIKNLVRYCDNTKTISAEMVNLFINIKSRNARRQLCDLFGMLSQKEATPLKVSDMILDINSWDPKYVDEPNFERRLKGFSSFTTMLKAKELSNKEIKPLLANCLFYSVESQDMSVRDASISCIFHVISFARDINGNNFEDLIQMYILPVLKNALRSSNEVIRNEFIGILAKIVKDFDNTSVSDMRILISSDPEVDFFENIKHIQIHRRIRAVRQLQQLVKENNFKQNSLFFFLLPLISHFVFDTTSSKDHNLVTATIETTGSIMSCLPWQKYSHFLRSYLRLLPKEKTRKKTIIRIVVAILDAFHFDLSMLTEADIKQESKDHTSTELNREISKESVEEEGIDKEADIGEEADESIALNETDVCTNDGEKEASRLKGIKIHHVIRDTILPQLHKSMAKKSFVEDYHRKSHNKEIDEDAVLRVPIALALVKLLQKLPKTTLHEQLPGILLRVCQTLKSRARDVRDTARETLVNIASSLGPEYFPFVLKEMKSVLQRGYQLHVLAYSLKSLFDGLMEQLTPGGFDQCLSSIIQILIQDLFQNVTEEKEAEGITGKLHEAKSRKSFDSFEIISRFASPSSFMKVIESVKEVLETNHKHEVSNKAQEVLRRIGLGLQNNPSLTLEDLLIYIYHTLKDLQPHLKDNASKDTEIMSEEKRTSVHEDIYLVKQEPARGKKIVERSKKANLHVLAEFTLQLFHSFLKNQRLLPSKLEHKKMLDPYVTVLIDCIKSKYNRVIILAVKSVTHLIRFPLPSFESNMKDLATALFKLLKNYARIGAGTGENYELVLSSFKAMTMIIRDAKKYKVTNEQLKILLAFVEEDIYDYTRQATAFPMLKAILSRKLNIQEIGDIMKKIAEISVTSESDSIQLHCRQLMLQYILDYPLGKKIENHFNFFISHLEYELENGRKSSLEMIALIFKNFPGERLGEYSEFFYFPLVMRLVNDESSVCRRLTNAVVKILLQKLESEKRAELFDLTWNWLQQDKISVKKLAIQAIGIFAEVEKETFEKRAVSLLPELKELIKPDLIEGYENDDEEELDDLKSKDQLLFNTLSSLMKIIQYCAVIKKPAYQEHFNEIWASIENHLLHAHTWVRLVSCQLFTQLFAAFDPAELVISWKANKDSNYLTGNLPSKVKMLCKDFCEQLKSEAVTEGLGEQIAKNLIYLMKIINLLEEDFNSQQSEVEIHDVELNRKDLQEDEKPPILRWLLTKLSYLASYEASKEQKAHIKRFCVFRCIAAVSLDLGKDRIPPFLTELLRPLHRELNSSSSDSELYKLAQEAVELIKEIVGKEMFAEMYAKLQRKVSEKKESRKRREAEDAVVNPEKFARKKQRKNLIKRDQRKRKLVEKKPSMMKRSKMAKQESNVREEFI